MKITSVPVKIIIALLLSSLSTGLFSQNSKKATVDVDESETQYFLETLKDDNTLFVYEKNRKRLKEDLVYKLFLFDSSMNRTKEVSITCKRFFWVSRIVTDKYLYVAATLEKRKSAYRIYKIDLTNLSSTYFEGKLPGKNSPRDVKISNLGDTIFIAGISDNGDRLTATDICLGIYCLGIPFLINTFDKRAEKIGYVTIDFTTSSPRKIDEIINYDYEKKDPEIRSFCVSKDGRKRGCLIDQDRKVFYRAFYLETDGKTFGKEQPVKLMNGYRINQAIMCEKNGKTIISGLYTSKLNVSDRQKANKLPSGGLFFCVSANGEIKETKCIPMMAYPFLESNCKVFDNAGDPKRKTEFEYEKELEVVKYEYFIHDLMINDSEITYFIDVFWPQYRTVTRTTSGPNGPITDTRVEFTGFASMGVIAVCFDHSGNLKWNNSLTLQDKRGQYFINTQFFPERTDTGFVFRYSLYDGIYQTVMTKSEVSDSVKVMSFSPLNELKEGKGLFSSVFELNYQLYPFRSGSFLYCNERKVFGALPYQTRVLAEMNIIRKK